MAKTATSTLAVSVQGDGLTLTESIVLTNATGSPPSIYNLAATNNTISFPPGSTRALIVPPAGNTVQLTLKGAPADTGVPLGLTDPTYLPVNFTSFILAPPSPVTITIYWG